MIPTACPWSSTSNMAKPENHKEEVPFAHYVERFRALDPDEALQRLSGTQWDGENFYVQFMHDSYAISHPEYSIRSLVGTKIPSKTCQIFILRYLLESQKAWPVRWLTFREMPWGSVYQVPFSGRILSRAAFTFGTRIDAFRAACARIGATAVDTADAAYEFNLIGNYRIRILIWEGDEEFPPSAQVLYSDNFALGFTAEDRVIAAELLIGAIKENM